MGLIEHTNLIAPERYGGRRFLYVANYLPRGHELLSLDAEALLAPYTPGPARRQPRVLARWVKQLWLHREPAAQPIVTAGYREQDPGPEDARTRARAGQHDADLPRGPRHELRGSRGRDAARAMLEWLPYGCPTHTFVWTPLETCGRSCRYWGHVPTRTPTGSSEPSPRRSAPDADATSSTAPTAARTT